MGLVILLNEQNKILKFGCGGIINPKMVLTCAHIFCGLGQNFAKVVYIPSALKVKYNLEKGFEAKKVYIPEQFKFVKEEVED